MENTTTPTDFPFWNMSNTTASASNTTAGAPKAPASFYPPGYVVIPADIMVRYRLTMYSAILPITAIVGLVGNVISFRVLLRHKMPKTTKMVLLAITVFDVLNLVSVIIFSLIGLSIALKYQPGLNAARKAYPIFGSYLQLVFGRVSALLVVVISLERFCAVFFPLKIKTMWSPKVMAASIVFCNIFAYLFFIPNALEYKPTDIPIPNSTEMKTILMLTEMGQDRSLYATFYSCNMIISRIVPVFLVLALNIAISVNLYYSRSKRSQMTSVKADDDQRITRTLLSVSFVYLGCMLPNAIVILVQLFDFEQPFPYYRTNVFNFVSLLCYWFEVINSYVNFIIYIFSSERMREDFKIVVGCAGSGPNVSKYASESNATNSTIQTSVSTISKIE